MRFAFLLFLLCGLSGGISRAESIESFDDDFFGPESTPYQGPQIRALDPEFFGPTKGYMTTTPPGKMGCINIFASSPMLESANVVNAIENYCAGPATRIWLSRSNNWMRPNSPLGYHQICCFRKADPSRRRAR
jgi:hypothetical protein